MPQVHAVRIACMVAESKPALRRADSTTPRSRRRGRALVLGLAVAALAGVAAAPIAANAGVGAVDGLEAVLGLAGASGGGGAVGSEVDQARAEGPTRAGPPRAIEDEDAGLRVRVSPTISTSISLGAPVTVSVEIENATGEALAPGRVRLVRAGEVIDDGTELADWVDTGAEGGAGIDGSVVALAETESRSLTAGGTTVVSFTVAPDAFADVADSPIIGLGTELLVGETVLATGAGVYPNADVPATGSVAVSLVAPLTAPITDGGTGLIDAAQLQNWTSPSGLLTRQLDALAGRRVAIGLDPRIIASIRVLGSASPASATAWLQRLAALPNEVFPLAYADADLAVQSQLGLPALLAPTSFVDVLDPANFTATPGEGDGDGADVTETPEPTDATGDPGPQAGDVPTTEELLDWPYTRTDIAWPADDTVAAGDLAYLDAAGLTTALLAPGNVEPIEGPTSSSANIEGSTALVADFGLTEPLRAASVASTDTEWRAATGQLLSELALDAGVARTTVVATFDRGAPARSDRVSALIDEVGGSAWSTLAGLADAIGAPPESRTLVSEPEADGRRMGVERMVAAEASVVEFSSVLDEEQLLTGPTRRNLLALLDVAWLDDREAWNAAVTEWVAAQRALVGAVSVVPSSSVLVVASETGIPITVDNTLPYAVNVVVEVAPSNGRLLVAEDSELTVEPQSRASVRVPVEAGVGNGEVRLTVSLSSTTGVPIGSTVTIPANVQADWEGLGAAILGALAVLVFGVGIWRNIRRRRRERAERSAAATDATDAPEAAEAPDAGEEPDATEAPDATDAADAPDAPQAPHAAEPADTGDSKRG